MVHAKSGCEIFYLFLVITDIILVFLDCGSWQQVGHLIYRVTILKVVSV